MTFVDDVQSNIVDISNVGKNDFDLILNVQLVEGLKHNLLSISQFVTKAARLYLNLLIAL